jgi:restriction endonuclease Mrr
MTELMPSQKLLTETMLAVLKQEKQGLHISEIELRVANHLKLEPAQKSQIQKGTRTVIGYKLAWARTKLKKEGKLESVSPSVWRIKD